MSFTGGERLIDRLENISYVLDFGLGRFFVKGFLGNFE